MATKDARLVDGWLVRTFRAASRVKVSSEHGEPAMHNAPQIRPNCEAR